MINDGNTHQVDRYILHIDDLTVELEPGVDVKQLAADLQVCMQEGKVASVPVQMSTWDGHIALVNPAQARIVYVSHAPVRVPRIGKPSGG